VNAKAGRNLVRQSALDHVTLKKLLEASGMPASVHPTGVAVRFDPDRIGYFGHSQGGLTGAVYAGIEHDLQAVVLSGTGGHLMTTVLLRTDPIDLRALAEGPLFLNLGDTDHIGPFHPALAFLQTIAEAADPLNYGHHWLFDADGGLDNIYMTNGLLDPYTPPVGAQALAAIAGLPQWRDGSTDSPAHVLYGIDKIDGPVQANIQTPSGAVTGVFRQFPGQGHFPVFDEPAISQWKAMFVSAFMSGGATIP
jgi:pimeloyl-ACP methyl ester carboxylesterase